jgi:hypothetical protein
VPAPFIYKDGGRTSLHRLRNLNASPTRIDSRVSSDPVRPFAPNGAPRRHSIRRSFCPNGCRIKAEAGRSETHGPRSSLEVSRNLRQLESQRLMLRRLQAAEQMTRSCLGT